MIDKTDFKNWLAEADRKASKKKIEAFIDNAIKWSALNGRYTFLVSTGRYADNGTAKTSFYDIWHDPNLSRENQSIVQNAVLEKYKEFGFDVKVVSEDCGYSTCYAAVKFTDIDKLVEQEETE